MCGQWSVGVEKGMADGRGDEGTYRVILPLLPMIRVRFISQS